MPMKLFAHAVTVIEQAEEAASRGAILADILNILRELSIDEFAMLFWSMPDPLYPCLSGILPPMAPIDLQQRWTGETGESLLSKSASFMRFASAVFNEVTGTPLRDKPILDIGCGYGRFLRLAYYFSEPTNIYGVDPWGAAIAACRSTNITENLAQSEELPSSLPFAGTTFDFMFAFSVFTHLSEDAALAVLSAMRRSINRRGVAIITIRPVEFWTSVPRLSKLAKEASQMHETRGFAFFPIEGRPHPTFGDSSISIDYFRAVDGWKVHSYDWAIVDPQQLRVCLVPD